MLLQGEGGGGGGGGGGEGRGHEVVWRRGEFSRVQHQCAFCVLA
jgi:hypothetical protein